MTREIKPIRFYIVRLIITASSIAIWLCQLIYLCDIKAILVIGHFPTQTG